MYNDIIIYIEEFYFEFSVTYSANKLRIFYIIVIVCTTN